MKLLAAVLCIGAAAVAHPLGNGSISHYARLEPTANEVVLTYALDFAEIPSLELFQSWDLEPRTSSRAQIEAKARSQARQWLRQLRLTSSGQPAPAELNGVDVTIGDGAGGALILRVTLRVRIDAAGNLQYEDPNYPDRAGWKEIVAVAGQGVTLIKSSHGSKDLSRALTEYPSDPSLAPPQNVRAELTWKASGVASVPGVSRSKR